MGGETDVQGKESLTFLERIWRDHGIAAIILLAVLLIAWKIGEWIAPKIDRGFETHMKLVAGLEFMQAKILETQGRMQDNEEKMVVQLTRLADLLEIHEQRLNEIQMIIPKRLEQ